MAVGKKYAFIGALSVVMVIGAIAWFSTNNPMHATTESSSEPVIVAMKRLNPDQYENIIEDIFGPAIAINGRLTPIVQRHNGLLEVTAAKVSLSPVDLNVAEDLGRQIAHQVVAERQRAELFPCRSEKDEVFDKQCATRFITSVGRLLFRRELSDIEVDEHLRLAMATADQKNNFYAGIERALVNLLVSPNFLFRIEYGQSVGSQEYLLTGYSRATRLSFLLWDSAPDNALLEAAQNGYLDTSRGLKRELERMLMSEKLERGVRAFFNDMLAFDEFNTLNKDPMLFPGFTPRVAKDAREQALKTIVYHLLTQQGDYRDLFVTPHTFLTPILAAQLDIPLFQYKPNAIPDRWTPYQFDVDSPHAGLLAQPAFVALHSHPGRTSPTLRGKALRENLLCQEVPPPPGDVDFSAMQEGANIEHPTTRDRLSAHATNPTCAGCHKITDPIGLALESFDAGGRFRMRENGALIDTSGDLDGVPFKDIRGLSKAMQNNASVVSCLVNRVYTYGVGDELEAGKRKWIKQIQRDFASDGYRLTALFKALGVSEQFYRSTVTRSPTSLAQR